MVVERWPGSGINRYNLCLAVFWILVLMRFRTVAENDDTVTTPQLHSGVCTDSMHAEERVKTLSVQLRSGLVPREPGDGPGDLVT